MERRLSVEEVDWEEDDEEEEAGGRVDVGNARGLEERERDSFQII
jgi:hypothetical protein